MTVTPPEEQKPAQSKWLNDWQDALTSLESSFVSARERPLLSADPFVGELVAAQTALSFCQEFDRALKQVKRRDFDKLAQAQEQWDLGGWEIFDSLAGALSDLRNVESHASMASIAGNVADSAQQLDAFLYDLAEVLDWGPDSPFRTLFWELSSRRRAASAVREAENAAVAARQAAGLTATASLGAQFESLASREELIGNAFRLIAFVVVVVGAILTHAVGWPENDVAATIAGHATILAATAALTYYSAKLAGGHISTARWGRALSVQLASLDAYCAAVDDPNAEKELRTAFGHRVFVAAPPDTSPSEETVPNLIEAIVNLTGVLRKGGDNT